MKLTTIFLSLLLFFACSAPQKETQNESEVADTPSEEATTTEVEGPKAGADCDDFLNDYEKYVDEVLAHYKNLETNPTNAEYVQKVAEASSKMAEWATKWQSLSTCADSDEYEKRMDEIQKKVDDVMGGDKE